MSEGVQKKKLIEVALPLEAINEQSAREKSIRHGHPSTLHLWWSRKPLATSRAVLFAQLVDDPSARPEEFPGTKEQDAERIRLHELIKKLVVWENVADADLLAEVRNEISKSNDGNLPPFLDPFAGGGSIPLEAQRLGLEANASDLNPVAVILNKALIELPPKFTSRPPVFPALAESRTNWIGAEGLASDVKAYGEWMRDEAEKLIGHQYPKAKLENGEEAGVIAWIWARTVTCPNPACGIEMPLTSKWWLSKKKGRESYIVPSVVDDAVHPSGKKILYRIGHSPDDGPNGEHDGTMNGRRGAVCVACKNMAHKDYIKAEARGGRMGVVLMSVVAEGNRRRVYLPATPEHEQAAAIDRPLGGPTGTLATHSQYMGAPQWGLTEFADLFTNRQLLALVTFSDLVGAARQRIISDALAAEADLTGVEGGAEAYADAVVTYLALTVSRCTDYWSSLCSWHSGRELIRNVFGRQAIPMVWDIAETMPFSSSAGNFLGQIDWVSKVIARSPGELPGYAQQLNAAESVGRRSYVISTDPPYYDNVPYADISDFFYVWLRRSLREIYPDLFETVLVPKDDELVADRVRKGGSEPAKDFFEEGFYEVFSVARDKAFDDIPMTVYYAFKQADVDSEGLSFTGWETLLDGMIRGGWAITATWPIRSEMTNRMRGQRSNALASSIVLALRPRAESAPVTDRRGFLKTLHSELPEALRTLQQGHIAPVDLPQAAIGPGMAVFSRYARVVEADGSQMTVRSALARINEILDRVLNEQEGDFDSTTRFAIAWYRQHGYATGKFGDANNIATARNVTVESMAQSGVLKSAAGKVTLIAPSDLPEDYNPELDDSISAWEVLQHMVRLLDTEGMAAAGAILRRAGERRDDPVDAELVKELAFLLFSLAEKNGWTKDAIAFNSIATSWPDIIDASRDAGESQITQATLDIEEE